MHEAPDTGSLRCRNHCLRAMHIRGVKCLLSRRIDDTGDMNDSVRALDQATQGLRLVERAIDPFDIRPRAKRAACQRPDRCPLFLKQVEAMTANEAGSPRQCDCQSGDQSIGSAGPSSSTSWWCNFSTRTSSTGSSPISPAALSG